MSAMSALYVCAVAAALPAVLAQATTSAQDDGVTIERTTTARTGTLSRICRCPGNQFAFEPSTFPSVRALSDVYMSGGDTPSSHGLSNLVWGWGQLLDHDLVATRDAIEGSTHRVTLTQPGNPTAATMSLHRVEVEANAEAPQCRMPITVNTPIIDAGPVYGVDEAFLQATERNPGACTLRTSAGDLLPVTTEATSDGGRPPQHFFVAGDLRVNEHSVLTSLHTVWVREHNRLCAAMDADARFALLPADTRFEKARKIVVAKFQHITLKQFLPALGLPEELIRSTVPLLPTPDVSVEFGIAYRCGHDAIPDTIGEFETVELFGGESFFDVTSAAGASDPDAANARMTALLQACGETAQNEFDGRFSDTIRDTLFGEFGEDLASRTLFRERDMGVVGYAEVARCFGVDPNPAVSILTDDAFLGLLRENTAPEAQVLGPTLRRIIADQFHRIFFGVGGHYWVDDAAHVAAVFGFEDEIAASTIAAVINANAGTTIMGDGMILPGPA